MELYIARHGQSLANIGLSVKNSQLTELGLRQADLLGQSLSDVTFDHIYGSTLNRAAQTAAGVARHQKQERFPVEIVPELVEAGTPQDFIGDGAFLRTIHTDVQIDRLDLLPFASDDDRAQYVLQQYVYAPAYEQGFDAERVDDSGNRICFKDSTVLLATHGVFMAYLLAHLVNFPFDEYMKKIGYAENVVNQIPYKLSHSSNHNIKFIYEEDICKMTTDTSIDFPTIQRENERIYNIAFKSEIESRAQKINTINELGTSICDYIYSKSPNPVSMTELLERFPTFSRQQISSSIMHSGSIVKKADKGLHYFEIDQNKYNIAQQKKDIQQKHNNMIKKKNTKANVYTAIDTDQFLAKINSQLPKIDTREEKADFLTLKSFYQNCDFSKKNENIQKKDYIYAIYLILKANEFKDVAYDKIFKLYSLLSKNEMSEEENKILTKYLIDSFRNDIDIIHGISLTHITKISNNTQKDFVNIEDFIEHETMIVYKKKM